MIPTPGQKVWIVEDGNGDCLPAGAHAAVVIAPNRDWGEPGWWDVHLEDWPNHPKGQSAHERRMQPRGDDPPPQREPKREQIGSWDGCGWQPAREIA